MLLFLVAKEEVVLLEIIAGPKDPFAAVIAVVAVVAVVVGGPGGEG